MADAPQAEKVPKQDDSHIPGLSGWERWLAGLVGLAGVVAGGFGVFLSSNQAGTTAILLLGAVFVLMAVQGTAIIKAGKDSVEMDRKREGRKLTKQAVEAIETKDNPREAASFIEKARAVDPSLLDDPSFSYLDDRIREEQLAYDAMRDALQSLTQSGALRLPEGATIRFQPDRNPTAGAGYDGVLMLAGRGKLITKIRRVREPHPAVPKDDVIWAQSLFMELNDLMLSINRDPSDKALMVVNLVPPDALYSQIAGTGFEGRIEVVKWTDESDNKDLLEALERLIGTD